MESFGELRKVSRSFFDSNSIHAISFEITKGFMAGRLNDFKLQGLEGFGLRV